MKLLERSQYDTIAEFVGDTPFSVMPYALLQRRVCDAYADSSDHPTCVAIVPHTPTPDAYVYGAASLPAAEVEQLADFLAQLDVGGFFVPTGLVAPIRSRRRVRLVVEGLCFTYRNLPVTFAVSRPEYVSQLRRTDARLMGDLPAGASFLYEIYGTPAALLAEGLAFGVLQEGRLVSIATSLALTPKHCNVGVYTRPRYRNRGYATDCTEALLDHVLSRGIQPLWRIGLRQKVATYFAEKLEMDEIGSDGREVYVQT